MMAKQTFGPAIAVAGREQGRLTSTESRFRSPQQRIPICFSQTLRLFEAPIIKITSVLDFERPLFAVREVRCGREQLGRSRKPSFVKIIPFISASPSVESLYTSRFLESHYSRPASHATLLERRYFCRASICLRRPQIY